MSDRKIGRNFPLDGIQKANEDLKTSIKKDLDAILGASGYGLIPLAKQVAQAAEVDEKTLLKKDYQSAIKKLTDFRFTKEITVNNPGANAPTAEELDQIESNLGDSENE